MGNCISSDKKNEPYEGEEAQMANIMYQYLCYYEEAFKPLKIKKFYFTRSLSRLKSKLADLEYEVEARKILDSHAEDSKKIASTETLKIRAAKLQEMIYYNVVSEKDKIENHRYQDIKRCPIVSSLYDVCAKMMTINRKLNTPISYNDPSHHEEQSEVEINYQQALRKDEFLKDAKAALDAIRTRVKVNQITPEEAQRHTNNINLAVAILKQHLHSYYYSGETGNPQYDCDDSYRYLMHAMDKYYFSIDKSYRNNNMPRANMGKRSDHLYTTVRQLAKEGQIPDITSTKQIIKNLKDECATGHLSPSTMWTEVHEIKGVLSTYQKACRDAVAEQDPVRRAENIHRLVYSEAKKVEPISTELHEFVVKYKP